MLIRRAGRAPWMLAAAALAVVAAGLLALALARRTDPPGLAVYAPVTFRSSASKPTDERIGALQARLERNDDDYAAYLELSHAYLQKVRETGDPSLYAKVEELLRSAERIDPQNEELFAAQSSLAAARHDFARALRSAQQALVLDPENARFHGLVGDAQIELGKYELALDSYQKMIDARPDYSAYSRVSHARELFGDPEGAQQAMQSAISASSSVPENLAWAHVQLGNLYLNLNNIDEAAREYETAAKLFEGYPPAIAAQGRVAAAKGDFARAAKLYGAAFDRMPLPEYAIALADVYDELGDAPKAAQQRELVLGIDKLFRANGVNTDQELALYFADHKLELPRAVEKARAVYAARPTIYAADALAWTLHQSGEQAEAAKYAKQATKLKTRDPLLMFHAGMIARANGDADAAREYLGDALGLNPRFSLLHADTAAAALKELGDGRPKTSGGKR